MKIYIAGKISGLNYSDAFVKFATAASLLRKAYMITTQGESRIISEISAMPGVRRRWRHLSNDTKRAVLEKIEGRTDRATVIAAINAAKRKPKKESV